MNSTPYTAFFSRKFIQNDALGFFKAPQLPAVKLGKILRKDTRVASPNDVIALVHEESFISSRTLIFTATQCFYEGGVFALEDVKGASADGDTCTLQLNQSGRIASLELRLGTKNAASALADFLADMVYFDPAAKTEATTAPDYSAYEKTALDWLLLRDEVMRTIDMLYDRYNDGKLSLLEYESKKEELLSRL